MRHGGEACTAANRFLVEAPIAAAFTTRLAEAMRALRMGPSLEPGVQLGPLVNAATRDKVERLVRGAMEAGARIVTGGARPRGAGSFYPPTVLADVAPDAPILGEDIFGPVASVVTFDDEATAVRLANATEHGLTAYVYTGDLARGLRVAERIEAGMVGLNRGLVSDPAAPFGGMKQSGLGREGGREGLLAFTETQYVAVRW